MRRLGFLLLIALMLAACSNAPQRVSRGSEPASSAYRTQPPGFPNFVDHSIGREEISIQAMSLVGVPYRWGGNTPDSGFDCSGLVRYVVLRAASVNLPRTTADMSGRGELIRPDEIAPGDLIFFNTTGRPHSHVGIYVGKLRFVNAPSTGGTVRLDYLTNSYWAKRFDGIRRVAAPLDAPVPFDSPTYLAAPRDAPAPPVSAPAYAAAGAGLTTPPSSPGAAMVESNAIAAGVGRNEAAPPASAALSVDPYEPPPASLNSALVQARTSRAVAAQAAPANVPASPTPGMAVSPSITTQTTVPDNSAPDPIDDAADAFEPPPPTAVARLQDQQAHRAAAATNGVRVLRASAVSRGLPPPSATTDDPIAGFANRGD